MNSITPSEMTNAEFVNTFLRTASEPQIEQEHLEVAKLTTNKPYGLKWQMAVRKVFYDNRPFERLRG